MHPDWRTMSWRPRFLLALLALALALVMTLWTVPTTFSVTARTESLRLVTPDSGSGPSWYMRDARMYDENDSAGRVVRGLFTPAAGSEVLIERISQGRMRMRWLGSAASAGTWTLQEDGQSTTGRLAARVVFVFAPPRETPESTQSSIFPLVGQIEVGRVLEWDARRRSGILREGKVSLLGHSILGGFRFDAGSTELDEGDQFSVEHPSGPGYGQVVLDERPGITTVFRVKASTGVISRFGSLGYNLGTSVGNRLAHDPVIQGVWALVLGLLGLPALFRRLQGSEVNQKTGSPPPGPLPLVPRVDSPSARPRDQSAATERGADQLATEEDSND